GFAGRVGVAEGQLLADGSGSGGILDDSLLEAQHPFADGFKGAQVIADVVILVFHILRLGQNEAEIVEIGPGSAVNADEVAPSHIRIGREIVEPDGKILWKGGKDAQVFLAKVGLQFHVAGAAGAVRTAGNGGAGNALVGMEGDGTASVA